MRSECSVSTFLSVLTRYDCANEMVILTVVPGARRKAHLNELEQAQRESSSAQTQEVERLRRENHQLTLENESLRAAYGSATSSPGPTVSPVNPRGSPSHLLPYGPPGAFLEAATAGSLPSSAVSTAPSTSSEASNLVVVVPNNIREIRRALHRLFAPIHEIPVVSNPQSHFATLAALAPSLPTSLKPTELQLSQPHNVYIDMIPSPRLRDRLIAIGPANSTTFIMQVCTIVYDVEDTGQMTIWGEDWLNEFSWEFSAPVLERWGGWLLTSEWGQRANFWRRQRGAPILPGYD